MKGRNGCERCGRSFSPRDPAYSCDRGCAWCGPCARGYGLKCPNCGGELAVRSSGTHLPRSHEPPGRSREQLLVAATPGVPDGEDGAA